MGALISTISVGEASVWIFSKEGVSAIATSLIVSIFLIRVLRDFARKTEPRRMVFILFTVALLLSWLCLALA